MPTSRHPVSQKQLAANRANAAKSTGRRAHNCKTRSAQDARELRSDILALYQPVNSQELFAIERLALTHQTLLGDTRLTVLPFVMQQGPCARGAQPPCQGPRIETGLFTTCLNEALDSSGNPALLMTKELAGNGGAERHYRRAVEEFQRLKALRQELPNEPIFDPQPEPNETT